MKNPIQPLYTDEHGTLRFKPNAIVMWLKEQGRFNMNELAAIDCSQSDREQFAMLIGYSLGGFSSLSYVSDDTYNAAQLMSEGKTQEQALIESLQKEINDLRKSLVEPMARLFGKHPDDLRERNLQDD